MLLTLFSIFQKASEEQSLYTDFWLSWGVTILVCIIFPLGYSWRDFFNKKIIECWIEENINGKPMISKEMEIIGTYVDTDFDQNRGLYKLILRHNFKKRIVYSEYSLDEYLSHFRQRHYLFIIYALDCYLFERKSSLKHIEEHYTRAGKFYLLFKAIYSVRSNNRLHIMGVFGSFLITGFIFCSFFSFDFIIFLLFGFIGIIIALVNTLLWERGVIKLKKIKEETESELYIMPKAPKYKIIDTYLVQGEKLEMVQKEDKPEKEWVLFEKEINDFNELQKIAESNLYRKIKYIKTKENKVLRSPEEIKNSRHNALYQMRYLYNQLIGSKENNARLQKDNRHLWDRLAYLNETMDQERRKFAMDTLLEQQRAGKTFKEIMKQIIGDQQIDIKWDKVVERALMRIESMKEEKRLEQMVILTQLLYKIVEKMSQNGGITQEINNIIKKLEIDEEDIIGDITKEKEKSTSN